eukprot:TRINITY_DN9578_c0_g1_i1.p1 TRINITY_DN9578_c0_g1~~TRINITY_DN9578_c0_g1_i1.p1  ORF type:complete len:345 (+),score=89.23 TRINITY_DN9578_c0_g1_i1:64-1098(+)
MGEDIRGLSLGKKFYEQVLESLLSGIPHSSALLGPGSEIIGYDDFRSTDHNWGPRALIFASQENLNEIKKRIEGKLPEQFGGWDTKMGSDGGEMTHHVEVLTFESWFQNQFGVVPNEWTGSVFDWLLTPQQRLLGITKGIVFRDLDGKIEEKRREMQWFPDDVWWWMMACQWKKIAQEEAFVQRTSEVKDEAGSSVVAARICRDIIKLSLLQSRKYAPYSKWLGTAFDRSEKEMEGGLNEIIESILHSNNFPDRERALCKAYHEIAVRHNKLSGSDLSPEDRQYWDRPARVIQADRFVQDCLKHVKDPILLKFKLFGSVDQFVDNTDVLEDPKACRTFRTIYSN